MIFVKQTLQYIRKNFFYLCVFAVLPSLVYTVNSSPLNVPSFFQNMGQGKSLHFLKVYSSFSFINYNSPLVTVFLIAVTAIFVALVTAFIEKHMRIGKKTFSGVLLRLNDNIMPVLWLVLLFLLAYELWSVLLAALLVMGRLLSGGTAFIILGISVSVLFYVVLFVIMAFFIVWLPCILMTGFNMGEAFAYSVSLLNQKVKIITALALPYAAGLVISVFAQRFLGSVAGLVVLGVNFLFYFIYYTVLMFVTYFHLANEPREDLRKKYF